MVDASSLCRERLLRGEEVDLRPAVGQRVKVVDGKDWGSDRVIEASMLMTVLTVPVGAETWTHRPVRLAGARITGSLDLEAATVSRPLHLEDCFIEQQVILNDAQASTIRLTGCHTCGIDGHALHTRGDLRLNDGFTATGEVNLVGAHIAGRLDCGGGTFASSDGYALVADGLVVDGDVFCRNGFAATGEVRLPGAHIRGQLNCTSGTFTNEDGPALDADGLVVDGGMFCSDGFAATGGVRLIGAHIGGQLICNGGTFTSEDGPALYADGLVVDGPVFCRGLVATGEVRLIGARIRGPARLRRRHLYESQRDRDLAESSGDCK